VAETDADFEIRGRIVVDDAGVAKQTEDSGRRAGLSYAEAFRNAEDEARRKALIASGGPGAYEAKFGPGLDPAAAAQVTGTLRQLTEVKKGVREAASVDAEGVAVVTGTINDLAKSTRRAGTEFSHAVRAGRELTSHLAHSLSPVLGQAIGAFSTAARSARFYGLATGGIIAGGVVLAMVLANQVEAINKETEAYAALAKQVRVGDWEGAVKGAEQFTAELDKLGAGVQDAERDMGLFQAAFARWQSGVATLSNTSATAALKLQRQLEAAAAAFKKFEVPKLALEDLARATELAKKIAEYRLSQESTEAGIKAAVKETAAAEAASFEVRRKQAREEFESRIRAQDLRGRDIAGYQPQEDLMRRTMLAPKLAAIDAEEAQAKRVASDRDRQRLARDRAERLQYEVQRIAGEKKLGDSVREAAEHRLDVERDAAKAEVAERNKVLGGLQEYQDKRRALVESGIELEKNAAQATYDVERQRLNTLIAAGGPEREQHYRELAKLDADFQDGMVIRANDAATKRVDAAKKEADEVREQAASVYSQTAKAAEHGFRLMDALGVSATQAQIAFWTKAVSAAAEGSDQQVQAIGSVIDAQKQLREEARSALDALLGMAKGGESAMVSMASVAADAAQQAMKDQRTLAAFQAGGQVRKGELQGALGRQGAFEGLAAHGVSFEGQNIWEAAANLQGVTQTAITPASEAFKGTLSTLAAGPSARTMSEGLPDVARAYRETFGGLESYLQGFTGRVRAMFAGMNSGIVDNVASGLGLMLQRDSKRGVLGVGGANG